MIDDLVGLAVAAAIDVEIERAAKKHRWMRILQVFVGVLFLVAIVGLIYITVKYS
ncbi:hypothetical protein [Azonexus sp.]|jgi:flagellar basal body-associated protein FliL|uniref:hypothetical protein n=1 Tax=Azonexus sp. TaxID=1872668 RepID=UPI00283279F6|nr:hypothetical protein [Azonexus sp.]MDR1995864.1 hypothetical protein [Azonexus sp.]